MHRYAALLRSFRAAAWPNLRIEPPRFATRAEMETFHSRAYLDFLESVSRKFTRVHDSAEEDEYGRVELREPLSDDEQKLMQQFGVADECTLFPEVWGLMRATVGGTLRALELLQEARATHPLAPLTALHWGGGRHHGQSDCAKGFCYCNDIVCGIVAMLSTRPSPSLPTPRILYLDIDLHHGDGVESAFTHSPSVLTCSFHHYAHGFYPGSGGAAKPGER